jgi:hypothetical protein
MHIINNWRVLHVAAPDGRRLLCIEGRVHGSNPRFRYSSLIRTSYLTAYQREESSMVIITSHGSEYLLGKHDPAEHFTERLITECLPERKQAPPARFDGVQTQVLSCPRNQKDGTAFLARNFRNDVSAAATLNRSLS